MFFLGLDLGQRLDFTAVAVVERMGPRRLVVRHLERMALGTPYTRVVARVSEIVRHPALIGRCRLVVDATGVGAPVVELLRPAVVGATLTAVTITVGEKAHGRSEEWHVPRKDLLTGLEVMLENGELKVSQRLREAEQLARELTCLRRTRSDGGEHDDLAMALGLACWRARVSRQTSGINRLPGI
jgi:hypothetical protein